MCHKNNTQSEYWCSKPICLFFASERLGNKNQLHAAPEVQTLIECGRYLPMWLLDPSIKKEERERSSHTVEDCLITVMLA